MRFKAEPALNQPICCSFIVWFRLIVSTLPSLCLICAFTGCREQKKKKKKQTTIKPSWKFRISYFLS